MKSICSFVFCIFVTTSGFASSSNIRFLQLPEKFNQRQVLELTSPGETQRVKYSWPRSYGPLPLTLNKGLLSINDGSQTLSIAPTDGILNENLELEKIFEPIFQIGSANHVSYKPDNDWIPLIIYLSIFTVFSFYLISQSQKKYLLPFYIIISMIFLVWAPEGKSSLILSYQNHHWEISLTPLGSKTWIDTGYQKIYLNKTRLLKNLIH